LIRLTLFSRPGCHLCEELRRQVETILADVERQWEDVDVDSDPELARRYGESIPVLFVNGRLFAKIRLPRLAAGLRLRRAATRVHV
jgi:thioredoxin-like negative regulator of GroEL